jgi:starch synthase
MALFKRNKNDGDRQSLRVLFVTAELAPFTSSDGAPAGPLFPLNPADNASLTAAGVAGQGARVSVIMPRYRRPEIDALPLEPVLPKLLVPLGEEKAKAAVFRIPVENGEVFFIDNPKFFLRERIFGTEHGDYLDNDERFAFFSRAVVEFILKAKLEFDIIHCRNWPTALVPLFLGTHYARNSRFRRTATVLSLEDMAAQGQFPAESLAFTGLNWDYFTPDQLALNGKFNYLKAGMIFADILVAAGDQAGDPGLAEILTRRGDSCVTISPGADGPESARQYLRLYGQALAAKKGGPRGR